MSKVLNFPIVSVGKLNGGKKFLKKKPFFTFLIKAYFLTKAFQTFLFNNTHK
jgi:hypothetical protein